jgi:hypothetical protein
MAEVSVLKQRWSEQCTENDRLNMNLENQKQQFEAQVAENKKNQDVIQFLNRQLSQSKVSFTPGLVTSTSYNPSSYTSSIMKSAVSGLTTSVPTSSTGSTVPVALPLSSTTNPSFNTGTGSAYQFRTSFKAMYPSVYQKSSSGEGEQPNRVSYHPHHATQSSPYHSTEHQILGSPSSNQSSPASSPMNTSPINGSGLSPNGISSPMSMMGSNYPISKPILSASTTP